MRKLVGKLSAMLGMATGSHSRICLWLGKSTLRSLKLAAATVATATIALPVTGFASAETMSSSQATRPVQGPQAASCNERNYCIYNQTLLRDLQCGWIGNDKNWANVCDNHDASSWNNGTSGAGVALYGNTGYGWYFGCLPMANYWIEHNPFEQGSSHHWTSSC